MSDEQKQLEAKKNFNNASPYLMKSNSFKNLDEKTIKDIEFLTEAFKTIFSEKSFSLYFYVEQKDSINNYFKNVLNQIILNSLQQQLNDENLIDLMTNLIDLMTNFFLSVVKLFFIYEKNPHPEYINVIRRIFAGYKDNYQYFSQTNDKPNK